MRTGQGGIVTVVGEAGIGKSRLVTEVRVREVRATDQPLRWVEGRSLSQSSATAYLPWAQLLRALLRLPEETPPLDQRATLRSRLADLGLPDPEGAAHHIGRLLSLSENGSATDIADADVADQFRRSTYRAVRSLLEAIAIRRPLVVAFDDLHWADPASLELLSAVLPLIESVPLLVVGLTRPPAPSGIAGDLSAFLHDVAATYPSRHTALTLDVLSARESERLVAYLLSSATPAGAPAGPAPAGQQDPRIPLIPPGLASTISDRSGGNPFHIEEIIRSLLDSGNLVCDPATCSWEAAGDGTALALPGGLHGLLAARIDRLPWEARHLLRVASVCGRFFSLDLLEAIAGDADLDAATLSEQLATLESAQMIRSRPAERGPGYAFKHQLLQEAAYAGLLSTETRRLHRLVAEALTPEPGEQSADLAGRLAYHWEAAGEPNRALPYVLETARYAQMTYANDEAVRAFRRVLELTAHARPDADEGADPELIRRRVAALRGLGKVMFATGRVVEADGYFRDAITLAREAGLPLAEVIRLYHWLGEALFWQNRMTDRLELGLEGLSLLDQETPSVELALMNQMVAVGHMLEGSRGRYREITRRTAAFIDRLPYVTELQPAYEHVIGVLLGDKEVERAVELLVTVGAKVDAKHDLLAAAVIQRQWGDIAMAMGDLEGALAAYEQVIVLDSRAGDIKHLGWALGDAAWIALQMGDLQRAEAYRTELEAFPAERGGMRRNEFLLQGNVRLSLIAGKLRRAPDHAQRLFAHYRDHAQPPAPAVALVLMGRVALATGDRGQAAEHFSEALALCRDHPHAVNVEMLLTVLNGLAEAQAGREDVTIAWPAGLGALEQWGLSRHEVAAQPGPPGLREAFEVGPASRLLLQGWRWADPLSGGRFNLADGLVIRVPNGRGLWLANRSAPRMLRPLAGDATVELRVSPSPEDDAPTVGAPAMGGLLLWQGRRDYLRLSWGETGTRSIALAQCAANRDRIAGAGALPEPPGPDGVWLRLERRGPTVTALCSLDHQTWWQVAEVPFGTGDAEIGPYALGVIDRTIYAGAYPEGTATRFTDFAIWA